MTRIHQYVTREIVRNVALASAAFCFLFLIFDFFDRIDNIITEDASLWTGCLYFLLKIPFLFNITLPIAMLVGTLFTIGIFAKNAELTAMRAAGLRVAWIARPVLVLAFVLSLLSMLLTETVIPYTNRRVREIYNIDIKEKDKTGTFSRSDFWWRDDDTFYSANMFDSRTNQLLNLSVFEVNEDNKIIERTDATSVQWLGETFGWTMQNVIQHHFHQGQMPDRQQLPSLPLIIDKEPADFYTAKTDPYTMSFLELRHFIQEQTANGIATRGYLADLYAKISFPFVTFFCALIVIPFALRPARSGSMAFSFIAGIIIAFGYFVIHSFSLAMGRAEMWNPLLAAWSANLLMGFVGLVLNLGSESPA